MKTPNHTILIAAGICLLSGSWVQAQGVTQEEATVVAGNWVRLIVEKSGTWGGAPSPVIAEIQHLRGPGGEVLGYYCPVEPWGFVVVPASRAMAPVKAYSEVGRLDPDAEKGPTGLIKDRIERLLEHIGPSAGAIDSAEREESERALQRRFQSDWHALQETDSDLSAMDYVAGRLMLLSLWHQSLPFNGQCPEMGCNIGSQGGRALVGCTATAAAQIARYWCWPPYGDDGSPYTDSYDWSHMATEYLEGCSGKCWTDEHGNLLGQVHQDAVAELCYELGLAADMNYGCDASGRPICQSVGQDMRDALGEHFRYDNSGDCNDRDDYDAQGWFDVLKGEFFANRPVLYHIPDHSIVADGWAQSGSAQYLHINYGWGPPWGEASNTYWYELDDIPGGDVDEEYALFGLAPRGTLGTHLTGSYGVDAFPYRYFDRATVGDNASFAAGQRLQVLPGITIACNSGTISFQGETSSPTYLFLNGDLSCGIQIKDGALKIYKGGAIRFPKEIWEKQSVRRSDEAPVTLAAQQR
jgi:hypothetical protein